MNINYVIVEASVIDRTTNINLRFKRLPTTQELAEYKSEKNSPANDMMAQMLPPNIRSYLMQGVKEGPRLDFEYVDMMVSLEEFKNSADLNVGSVVVFNIPTSLLDIVNITPKDKQLIQKH